MLELNNFEIDQVSGGTGADADALAAGVATGASIGFFLGGPVGAGVGAFVVGVHFLIATHALHLDV